MCDWKRKLENFEMFSSAQMETDSSTQDKRLLHTGTEVIRNNARCREVGKICIIMCGCDSMTAV